MALVHAAVRTGPHVVREAVWAAGVWVGWTVGWMTGWGGAVWVRGGGRGRGVASLGVWVQGGTVRAAPDIAPEVQAGVMGSHSRRAQRSPHPI